MSFSEIEKKVAYEVRTNTKINDVRNAWAVPISDALYDLTVAFKEGKVSEGDAKKRKKELEKQYSNGSKLIGTMKDIGEQMAKLEAMSEPMESALLEEPYRALIDLVSQLSKMGYKDCPIAIIEDVERKYQEKMKDSSLHSE